MAAIFDVPVSLVSLIDKNQLCFKSVVGPFGCGAARQGEAQGCLCATRVHRPRRAPRATRPGSFCDALLVPPCHEMLVVEDATQDARFVGNAYVAGPPGELAAVMGCLEPAAAAAALEAVLMAPPNPSTHRNTILW